MGLEGERVWLEEERVEGKEGEVGLEGGLGLEGAESEEGLN